MRAEILQTLTIALHGNQYLSASDEAKAPELLARNAVLLNAFELEFNRSAVPTQCPPTGTVALGTARWYKRLRAEGVEHLTVRLPHERRAPFVPGKWGIRSDGDVGIELWCPLKYSRPARVGDTTPWRIVYVGTRDIRKEGEPEQPVPTLDRLQGPFAEVCRHLRRRGSVNSDIADRVQASMRTLQPHSLGHDDILGTISDRRSLDIAKAGICAVVLCTLPNMDDKEDEQFAMALDGLWAIGIESLEQVIGPNPNAVAVASTSAA